MRKLLKPVFTLIAGLVLALVLAQQSFAALILVTNGNDSGPGSLRAAILQAETTIALDQIELQGPSLIVLQSSLPDIFSPTAIFSASTLVTIRRAATAEDFTIFTFSDSGAGRGALSRLRIEGASGPFGAVRMNRDITLVIDSCEFANNTASGLNSQSAGAIYLERVVGAAVNQKLTVRNSTFINNSGPFGGAISAQAGSGSIEIVNSTFVGNQSPGGGAISYLAQNSRNSLSITNSTFSANSAPAITQAINSPISIGNSIFQGAAPQLSLNGSFFTSRGGNLSSDALGMTAASDLRNVDARLAPLGNYGGVTQTLTLQQSSPAINIGSDTTAPPLSLTKDQRGDGFPRLQGNAVDSGAVEIVAQPCNYATSVPELVIPAAGVVNQAFVLLTQGGCAWNALSQPSFVSGVQNSGTGTAYFFITVPATLTPRTGSIVFTGGATLLLRQQGLPLQALVTNLNDAGDGSLREAITLANTAAGSSVLFQAGLTGTINLATALPALSNISIFGPGANLLTLRPIGFNGLLVNPTGSAAVVTGLNVGGVPAGFFATIAINNQGTLLLSEMQISNNTLVSLRNSGNMTVRSSAITDNSNIVGISPVENSGVLRLINTTLAGNSVSGLGQGVIRNDATGQLSLVNCTYAKNTSNLPNNNSGLVNSGVAEVFNSIISDNSGTPVSGNPLTASSANNLIGASAIPLGNLQNNGGSTPTLAIVATSAAHNAGSNAQINDANFGAAPFTDQRGAPFARISDGSVDIGAFEVQFQPEPIFASGFE
jgi:hypothetical protein